MHSSLAVSVLATMLGSHLCHVPSHLREVQGYFLALGMDFSFL